MPETYLSTKKLFHLIIRVPKEEASFTYFTLESHDGLAFYSTLDHREGQNYRDIEITCTIEFKEVLTKLLQSLGEKYPIQYLVEEIISDID